MADANFRIILAQNVCTMPGAVHPTVHDLSRACLSVCDVLTGGAVGYAGFVERGGEGRTVGAGVGEGGRDFLCSYLGCACRSGIQGEGREAGFFTFFVYQSEELGDRLVGGLKAGATAAAQIATDGAAVAAVSRVSTQRQIPAWQTTLPHKIPLPIHNNNPSISCQTEVLSCHRRERE